MNYKLKKECIGKPMGVSDVNILFEEEPNYGRFSIIKHDELLEKIDKLEKKLDIAVKALRSYSKPYFVTELGGYYVNSNKEIAEEALKQIKEVK